MFTAGVAGLSLLLRDLVVGPIELSFSQLLLASAASVAFVACVLSHFSGRYSLGQKVHPVAHIGSILLGLQTIALLLLTLVMVKTASDVFPLICTACAACCCTVATVSHVVYIVARNKHVAAPYEDRMHSMLMANFAERARSESNIDVLDETGVEHEEEEEEEAEMSRGSFVFLLSVLSREAAMVSFAVFCGFVAVAASFYESIFWGSVVGLVSNPESTVDNAWEDLVHAVVQLFLAVLLNAVCFGIQAGLMRLASKRAITRLRTSLYDTIIGKPVPFHIKSKPGELMSRLSNDVNKISEAISNSAVNLIEGLCAGSVGVVVLFVLDWRLTLVVLASAPVLLIIMIVRNKAIARYTEMELDATAKATASSEEVLNSIPTVVAYDTIQYEGKRYSRRVFQAYLYARTLALYDGVADALNDLVLQGAIVVAIFYAGYRVLVRQSTVAKTVTYLLILMQTSYYLSSIPDLIATVYEGVGSSGKILQLLSGKEEEKEEKGTPTAGASDLSEGGVELSAPSFAIEFDNVSFSYSSDRSMVLSEFSMTVERGQFFGISGPSGVGKSTIANLLLAFYRPQEGQVLINGERAGPATRRLFGFVPQRGVLFHSTLRANLMYGCSADVTEERLTEVLRMCHCLDFIRELPRGLDTNCGSKGTRLSGGQVQRICLARAMLRNPQILLLDEPCASLDGVSSRAVVSALQTLKDATNCTILLISHREELLAEAHCVLEMQSNHQVNS